MPIPPSIAFALGSRVRSPARAKLCKARPGCGLTRSRAAQTGQFLRQRPQPLPGLRVVGLLFGACLTLPLEVAPRDLPEIRVGDQVDRRRPPARRSRRYRTPRRPSSYLSASPVQAVCGNARALELPSQVEGEHDAGQLALGIRSHAGVAPL